MYFVFGGQGRTTYLGDMIKNLNADAGDFDDFVRTLQGYNVSFIEFDIETSWDFDSTFADQFESFAEQMAAAGMPVIVGASAPIGTVNTDWSSNAPAWLDGTFAAKNQVYFNVYTYATDEYANVVSGTDWLPTNTNGVAASQIMFSITSNNTKPATATFIDYADFVAAWPTCAMMKAIDRDGYAGVVVWVWWENFSPYVNTEALFTSFEVAAPAEIA